MNPTTAAERAQQFVKEAGQFRLGRLTTETPHPKTTNLSQTVKKDIPAGLAMLFSVDLEVIETYRKWAESGSMERIAEEVYQALSKGGRLFFTGCGATGRLSIQLNSMWRDFWQKQEKQGYTGSPSATEWEQRACSVMAGGDYALIKSVEGFEDYTQFGKRQMEDNGISQGDVVFAITEGGETSFVIGTAWKGLEKGARVFFVYDNPDSLLREDVIRSREIIDEPRIEKINLTTGPMAITGSTRMQATSIQLCMMSTLVEMVLRKIIKEQNPNAPIADSAQAPAEFLRALETAHETLNSQEIREQIAQLILQEEKVYKSHHKNTYFADRLGIDVLTDTTERSPTFCVPAFRKFDDMNASESWSFLHLPLENSEEAWKYMMKRDLNPVSWDLDTVRELIGEEDAKRQYEIVKTISYQELMRFRIGLDGLEYRPITEGDCATGIVIEEEIDALLSPDGFYRTQLEKAHAQGAATGVAFFGSESSIERVRAFLKEWEVPCTAVLVPTPSMQTLLNNIFRITSKLMLNALSTLTMVRLGRVMGNVMIWVVPSNLKLIDRATRYIQTLSGISYEDSCLLLHEAIDYVAPRMSKGKEYPATVGLSVIRAREKCSLEEAEKRLYEEL